MEWKYFHSHTHTANNKRENRVMIEELDAYGIQDLLNVVRVKIVEAFKLDNEAVGNAIAKAINETNMLACKVVCDDQLLLEQEG
jgi:hypothetical protein